MKGIRYRKKGSEKWNRIKSGASIIVFKLDGTQVKAEVKRTPSIPQQQYAPAPPPKKKKIITGDDLVKIGTIIGRGY